MSLVVCGKRSLFDDLYTSPPVSKRLRCGGTNSARSWSFENVHLSDLKGLFPDMDEQILQKILESCGDDLDSAIKNLKELQLRSNERNLSPCRNASELGVGSHVHLSSEGGNSTEVDIDSDHAEAATSAIPVDGSEWIELLVREIRSASDFDEATARASRALEALEKTILIRTGSVVENLQKEDLILKEEVQSLLRDNNILKRAVAIQHELQQEHEERGHELQHLKQLLSQYQDQLRTLEVNNYALTMHLSKAQENSIIPGRFHPDVF
eukprot:Gb_38390 [translate_table: standard]